MSEELKPCPFCGGKAKLRTGRCAEDAEEAWVTCEGCDARTEMFEDAYAPIAQALDAWNRRAAPSSPEHAGDVEGLVDGCRQMADHVDAVGLEAMDAEVSQQLREAAGALLTQARLLEERTRERDEALNLARSVNDDWFAAATSVEARAEAAERLLEEMAGAGRKLVDNTYQTPSGTWYVGGPDPELIVTGFAEALSKVRVGGDFSASQGCGTDQRAIASSQPSSSASAAEAVSPRGDA